MLNQITFVGRISKIDKLAKNKLVITVAIPRTFKNTEGFYDTDFIKVDVANTMAENVIEYCKIGDIIGIRGRIANLSDDDGNKIVCEKLTFLSSKKDND